MKLFLINIIFLIIITGKSFTQSDYSEIQTFIDSNYTRSFLTSYFDNNNNTATFISRLNLYKRLNKFNFTLKNYYISSVTKLEKNLYRDFDNIKLTAGYSFNDKLNLSANYTGQFFSDDKSFQLKGSSSNLGYLSLLYESEYKGALLNSFLNTGYKYESQYDEINRGISIYNETNIYSLNLMDFLTDAQLKFGYENLNPRKNSIIYGKFLIEKPFENNLARNEFFGIFSIIRKDFYFPADLPTKQQYSVNNNIEKRTEKIFRFFNRFDYSISKSVSLIFNINPDYKNITKENVYIPLVTTLQPSIYDTEIQEVSISGDAAIKIQLSKIDYQLKFYYRERDEKHFLINSQKINSTFINIIERNEATKNNHSSIFKINSNLYYNINLMNRIELNAGASILKYDTQSELNYDDRDELGYMIYLAHRFNNLNNLLLINSIDLNLYHTVYIFSQKSSNNNWNRVIRFTSRSYFEPNKKIRNVGVFSVLANYTVYDFQDILSNIKSYAFRQLNLKDSLIVNFNTFLGTKLYGEMKFYQRGELNWKEFVQKPINYFEDKIINSELIYYISNNINISGGYKFFEQKRYNYVNNQRVFDKYVRTSGPFLKLTAYWKQNSYIELTGMLDNYTFSDGTESSKNFNVYLNSSLNF